MVLKVDETRNQRTDREHGDQRRADDAAYQKPQVTHWSRALLIGLAYALITALITIGIAFILSLGSSANRDAAFLEIQSHRNTSRCFQANMTVALNEILDDRDLNRVPAVDTSGLDCTDIPSVKEEP